jgi:hypothetical protein
MNLKVENIMKMCSVCIATYTVLIFFVFNINSGKIVIATAEDVLPYERIKLSKVISKIPFISFVWRNVHCVSQLELVILTLLVYQKPSCCSCVDVR